MKNLINIFAILTITITSVFATSNPVTLISTDEVVVVTIGELAIFTSAEFDAETDNLAFTTNEEISMIQIFNADGELEFQLPAMSKNVKVNKNLFDQGTYKLGFMLVGENQLHTTQVTIK